MTKGIKEFIKNIKKEIDDSFGRRVVTFVFFGTSCTNKVFNDIDLELLLDEPHLEDFQKLNTIFSNIHKLFSYKIDLHLSYKSQLTNLGYFRRKAQGSYLLWSLAKGELLLGTENYFKRMLDQTPTEIILKDLFIKNQEYQYSLREYLIENDFVEKRYKFCKYLIRYLYQLAIVSEKLTYDHVLNISKKKLLNHLLNLDIFNSEIKLLLKTLYEMKKLSLVDLLKICSLILYETDKLMIAHYRKLYG